MSSKLPSSTTSTSSSTKTPTKSKNVPAPLSISTFPPSSIPKSLTSNAHPHPATPHRTASSPYPPPSPSIAKPALSRISTETPKSAGHVGKNVKFGFGKHSEEGDRRKSEGKGHGHGHGHGEGSPKLRSSHENHVNVHTECGRHGDDWLFGGWNVGGVVKKVFGRGE